MAGYKINLPFKTVKKGKGFTSEKKYAIITEIL